MRGRVVTRHAGNAIAWKHGDRSGAGAGVEPSHFSCSFAIVPSIFRHSMATSSVLRNSAESLRSGAAHTRPVE